MRAEDLGSHQCIVVASGGHPTQWPFPGPSRPRLVPVDGRLTVSSFAMARAAALADLGVALFPEFACADDLQNRRLVPVLDDCVVDVGRVWLLYIARRFLPARLRAFVDLARERLAAPPWQARAVDAGASCAPAARSPRRRR
jgi:DNA-binding transcriptional LysR family regulator